MFSEQTTEENEGRRDERYIPQAYLGFCRTARRTTLVTSTPAED
jgi:hypothetical protein